MPRKITYKEFEHRITEKFGNEVDLGLENFLLTRIGTMLNSKYRGHKSK